MLYHHFSKSRALLERVLWSNYQRYRLSSLIVVVDGCQPKGSHKKKLGKSGQADRLGGSPPSSLTASIL